MSIILSSVSSDLFPKNPYQIIIRETSQRKAIDKQLLTRRKKKDFIYSNEAVTSRTAGEHFFIIK